MIATTAIRTLFTSPYWSFFGPVWCISVLEGRKGGREGCRACSEVCEFRAERQNRRQGVQKGIVTNYLKVPSKVSPERNFVQLARTANAIIAPMAAVMGGITGQVCRSQEATTKVNLVFSQEILKATSGKFTPIQQFYYFSAAKCLPADRKASGTNAENFSGSQDRYHDYVTVFGKKVQEGMSKLRSFIFRRKTQNRSCTIIEPYL